MTPSDRQRPAWILPVTVVAQVLVTSTWFAANAVAGDISAMQTQGATVGQITLMVQLGFIVGTLVLATTGISDAISGRVLFTVCALLAATSNAAILLRPADVSVLLGCRFATGVALAGVYPVGMKIAASWYATGLGRALGYLVGALVLGTSFTHLLRAVQVGSNWQYVILASTSAAVIGGWLITLVPDGPYHQRSGAQRFKLSQLREAWSEPRFRRAALAYFGHMWELYAFWAFMPRWIQALELPPSRASLCAFLVIAVGALGCVVGGIATQRFSSRAVARFCLVGSCMCCVVSPLIYDQGPWGVMALMILWGIFVVSDSPQLSSLNAQSAPRHLVGSALTATTCIGFSITVFSLLFLDWISTLVEPRYLFLPLAIGPAIGFVCLGERDQRAN